MYQFNNNDYYSSFELASFLNVESKTMLRNFQRNKEKYVEGIDYIKLQGSVLKQFKTRYENDDFKYTSVLILWSNSGARLLAKSLNKDEAWKLITNN